MKKEIPIFFACDDNYIPLLGNALYTLLKHASEDYHYTVIVLNAGLKKRNKERIKEFETKHDNLEVKFADISKLINEHYTDLAYRLRDYYSVAIYFRMFIPTMFPEYDKAIYLDADLILVGDISELYNTNIEGKLVAAINDKLVSSVPTFAAYANNAVGISADEYFNSGVLVMNLKKFREDDIETKFLDLLKTYNFDTVCPDQDYLNVLCRNDKVLLHTGWNKMPLEEPGFDYTTLKLLHYNSFEKPWHYDHVRYGDKFWEESAGSPFYEDLLKIRNSVDENHIKKGKQGEAALLEKALYLAEQDEGTFKKTLAL